MAHTTARRRSKLISMLGGWMLLRGAFGLLFGFLIMSSVGVAEDGGSAAGMVLLPAFGAVDCVIGVGLLARKWWSFYLMILIWSLVAFSAIASVVMGTALLPIGGGAVPGFAGQLGSVAISGAIQLFLIYWLLAHRDEFD